jgi:hypothetical protein
VVRFDPKIPTWVIPSGGGVKVLMDALSDKLARAEWRNRVAWLSRAA